MPLACEQSEWMAVYLDSTTDERLSNRHCLELWATSGHCEVLTKFVSRTYDL